MLKVEWRRRRWTQFAFYSTFAAFRREADRRCIKVKGVVESKGGGTAGLKQQTNNGKQEFTAFPC